MEKIERVARAICQAYGKDPDMDSGRGKLRTVVKQTSAMSKMITEEQESRPNWCEFELEARAFMAAHEALSDTSS
jgi:hypothetical protein